MICSRAFMLFRMLFLLRKELPGLKSIRSGQLFFFIKCTESRGQICSGEIPGPGLRTGRTGGRRS